jgi:hypothetical protein
VNPTEIIPQGTVPETADSPVAAPGSGISRAPLEKSPRTPSAPAPEGLPADVRNLAIGAGLLSVAFLVFWMGSYLANHVALRTVIASFGTFALVWVLYRLRVFQRPHGGLIGAGAVALFAAALPFAERAFKKLDHVAKTGLGDESARPPRESADQLRVPTRETAPPAPVAGTPTAPSAPPPPAEDDTVRELIAPEPDPSAKRVITVVRDVQITMPNGKKYRIREGSKFPYTKFEDGIVTFQAGGQDATINSTDVRFTGVSRETPQHLTQLAQVEAMRRYPALADKDSEENHLYLERVAELKVLMPDLLKDPLWPLNIADKLAATQGWKRADGAPAETPPPEPPAEGETNVPKPAMPLPPVEQVSPLPPADPAVPAVPPIPPVPSEIPKELPPAAK